MLKTSSFLTCLSSLMIAVALPLVAGCAGDGEPEVSASADDALSSGRLAPEYQGTILNLPIMVRLELAPSGGAVRGSYFYVGRTTKGEVITLNGRLEGTRLVLTESVGETKTGTFDGRLQSGRIEGTWTKADGTRHHPFQMSAVFAGEPFTIERKIADTMPALETSGIQKTCDVEATYLEVFGLADPAVTRRVNAELAAQPLTKCEYAESSYSTQSVKFQNAKVLVVETMGSWFGGGAHPIHGMQWQNISLTTGEVYGSQDVFKADAKDALRTLLLKGIAARADLDKDLGSMLSENATFAFEQKDVLTTLDYFATADGIRVSLFNWLPHAMQAADMSGTLLPWRDVKPLLMPGTAIATLSPAL